MSFRDKLAELLKKRRFWKRKTKNKLKKLLTSKNAYDRIYELSLRQQRTLKTEQYVKPWKFYEQRLLVKPWSSREHSEQNQNNSNNG